MARLEELAEPHERARRILARDRLEDQQARLEGCAAEELADRAGVEPVGAVCERLVEQGLRIAG